MVSRARSKEPAEEGILAFRKSTGSRRPAARALETVMMVRRAIIERTEQA
jgi:hypothetical protein